jgi:hypothetical protein
MIWLGNRERGGEPAGLRSHCLALARAVEQAAGEPGAG